jgi:hypothetical protein
MEWSAGAALFALGLVSVIAIPVSFAPYSFVIVIPAFAVASAFGEAWLPVGAFVGALLAPAMFVVLSRYVVKTGRAFPFLSVVTFALLVALSAVDAIFGWHGTVQYTWHSRAVALVTQALLPPVALFVAALVVRKSATVRVSLVLHWLALAWLAWGAFPWYGELL